MGSLTSPADHNTEDAGDGAYGSSSLSEETRTSYHLQMSLKRQHILLSYFKTLSVGPVWESNPRLYLTLSTGPLSILCFKSLGVVMDFFFFIVDRLQRLLDTLDKDEDKQKKRLGEMTRKITVLRVNEKSLSRRYTAMQEVEAALRKENKKYKNDVVAMETAITERLGYLQRHKV